MRNARFFGTDNDKVVAFAIKNAGIKSLEDITEGQIADLLDLFNGFKDDYTALVRHIDEAIKPPTNGVVQPASPIDGALMMAARGVAQIRLVPRNKMPISESKGWETDTTDTILTTNPDIIRAHNGNFGCGAIAKVGKPCFFEIDNGDVLERIKTETRHDLASEAGSFLVRSRSGRGHVYFLHTEKSVAAGNIAQGYVQHQDWSFRGGGQFVVTVGSIHPKSNQPYELLKDGEIRPIPDWLVDWMLSQKTTGKKNSKDETERNTQGRIPHGAIHSWLVSQAGRLRSMGLENPTLETALIELAEKNCAPPLDLDKVKQVARSFEKYPEGKPTDIPFTEKPAVSDTDSAPLFNPNAVISARGDMSDAVLSGVLGEVCQMRLLKDFPISYAWLAILAAAGVRVPRPAKSFIENEVMTTSFTALVGSLHSGKSQAIEWGRKVVGLPECYYTETKAGSAESLLLKLHRQCHDGKIRESVMIDLDEWAHLFAKAKIENSTFSTFLQTAFYKRHHEYELGQHKHVNFDCAISIEGGIVEDQFDFCFGANTMGGLHDRFTFGLCPEGYNFMYRPFEGGAWVFNPPIPVHIDPEIWEMVKDIRKENPKIGREAELAIRAAHICASFDGREILKAKDCESAVKAFIVEQLKIRERLQPNGGITNDAHCANALTQWLERNVPNGELAWERDVRQGLRKTLERLGPGVLEYCTKNLSLQGVIWYGEITNAKAYNGRKPRGYRLLKQTALELETETPAKS